jgi:hypothetical protein
MTAIENEYQFLIRRAQKEGKTQLALDLDCEYDKWKRDNPTLVAQPAT